jgi:hypothetical protein
MTNIAARCQRDRPTLAGSAPVFVGGRTSRKIGATFLLSVVTLLADQAFTGTWKMNGSKVRFPQVPSRIELAGGMYKCLSCNPAITVRADGTDQPVHGYPYDALSVRIIDSYRVEIIQKKAGTIIERYLFTANASYQEVLMTTYPDSGGTGVTARVVDKRIAPIVPGMHPTSGTWLMQQPDNISDEASTIVLEQTSDGLAMSAGSGEHYLAKFDGKDYPDQGTTETDVVSLRHMDARTIEETDKLKGKVVSVNRLSLSPDGKTLNVSVQLPNGRTQSLVFEKQK